MLGGFCHSVFVGVLCGKDLKPGPHHSPTSTNPGNTPILLYTPAEDPTPTFQWPDVPVRHQAPRLFLFGRCLWWVGARRALSAWAEHCAAHLGLHGPPRECVGRDSRVFCWEEVPEVQGGRGGDEGHHSACFHMFLICYPARPKDNTLWARRLSH